MRRFRNAIKAIALTACAASATGTFATQAACSAESGASQVPVLELYTSEGCSSCPPADQWLSGLKGSATQGKVVVQAFHVGYWDYIGWVDRFAAPAHTTRQRQVAAANGQRGIYTPQLVRNGQDWRDYGRALTAAAEPARVRLALKRLPGEAPAEQFEALVTPLAGAPGSWSAYWTVTEHGHNSKVQAGENAGESLRHDFVVRQYVQAGEHQGAARLTLRPVAADGQHARQVNLVVFDPRSGRALQALSVGC